MLCMDVGDGDVMKRNLSTALRVLLQSMVFKSMLWIPFKAAQSERMVKWRPDARK